MGDGARGRRLAAVGSVLSLVVASAGGWFAFSAFAKTSPPPPPSVSSINRADASPTNAGSVHWAVTFSGSVSGVDTTDFALARTGALTGGSVTTVSPASGPASVYTVTATTGSGDGTLGLNLVDNDSISDSTGAKLGGTGLGNGNFTGQTYTVDKTAPTLSSFTRSNASPTAAASVSWQLVFSEPVATLTAGNFTLVPSSLSGSPAITGVSGSGTTWSVSASTGTGTPSGVGSLGVNLTGASDLAGNALGAPLPKVGPTYQVDKAAPAVSFTSTPPDPSTISTSRFVWQQSPSAVDFDHYECSTENGAFSTTVPSSGGPAQACASPLTYVVAVNSNGLHQFALRAYDHNGNYTQISYSWRVSKGSPQAYTITGGTYPVGATLYPTSAATGVPINITFSNPNSDNVLVSSIHVTMVSLDTPNATPANPCDISEYGVTDFTGPPFQIPPGNSSLLSLSIPQATWPTVREIENGTPQNGCIGATIHLKYGAAS